jgi:hypothetical protein
MGKVNWAGRTQQDLQDGKLNSLELSSKKLCRIRFEKIPLEINSSTVQ